MQASRRALLLAVLLAATLPAGAAAPAERLRGREDCGTASPGSGDRKRLLEPALFDRLSSGGRRLARALNGLPGPARVEAGAPGRHLAPLAAPEPRKNVRVNDPAMDLYGHTNSESSVTVSGGTIVVGFNDAGEDFSGYAFSTDGGASFTHRRPEPPPDGYLYGDPVLATGPSGEVYFANLMTVGGGLYSTVGVSKSADGGQTFGPPVDAVNAYTNTDDVMDKPWLAVDASPSKYRGSVYVTWTYFAPSGETVILFARSNDGGTSFSAPGALSPIDTAGVQGSAIAVGPAGEVYVAWLDGHVVPTGISVLKSTDGGATFGSRVTVATLDELTMLTGGGGVRANSFPSLAVDGAGRVHVSWAALPTVSGTDRSDVFYSRSTDGGATFSTARRLNDDATATTQAMPALAASPGGKVAVRWIDRRDDPANDALTGVSMAISADGGATFGRSFRVTDTTFAYGPVDPGLGRGYHGDYDGLAWSDGTLFVTWSDERGSDPDVYFARIPEAFDPESPDLAVTPSTPWAPLRAGARVGFDLATRGTGTVSGPLSLSLSPPGPGLSFSFVPPSVAAGEPSRLNLAASEDVAGRDETLTATAAGGGLARSTVLRATTYPASRPFEVPVNATRTRGFTGGAARYDAEGRIHLLYEDDTEAVAGSDVFYRRSAPGDAVFSAPLRLSPAGGLGYDPVLAAGPGGRVIAAWAGRASGDTYDRVYVARSTNGGETFSAPVAVSPSTQLGARPAVAVDGAGNVVVAWYDFVPSVAVLYTARSGDGGASFAAPVAIGEDAVGVVTRPGLAFDSKGAAYLVYTRQYVNSQGGLATAARISVARDGKTFAAPASLTDVNTVASFGPDVAVGANDAVHVAYYTRVVTSAGTYNREVVAVHSTDGGATFSTPVSLSKNNGQSWFPSLAVEPSGAVSVAWEDDTGRTTSDILLSRSTDGGATFSDPVDLSADAGLSGSAANPLEDPGGSGRVAVSANATGRLLVSWLDDSPANPDVFFVRLDPRALSNRPPVAAISSPAAGATFEAGVPVAFTGTGTDPDGDALSYSWLFGDGGSASGATPAPHPFARPGSYAALLTVTDPWGASAAASVTVTVTAPSTTGTSLLVPVVLESDGVGGSRFTSELTIASRAATSTEVVLSYTASLGDGSGFARLTLAPGEQRIVPGVLGWLRGQGLPIPADGTSQAGTLLVTFGGASGGVFAGARTFTPDPAGTGGTFGVFAAAAPTISGPVTVFGLQQNASMRSNLAVVNGGNGPVILRIALVGPAGEDLGLLPDQPLGPWGWAQVSQPLSGKAASGRAVVTRISGASPFTAYGVLNDAVTSDGSWLPPLLSDDGSGADRLVPVVLDVEGVGARFRTELTFTNGTAAALPLTLVYTAAPGFGSGSGSVPLALAPFEQRIVPDAISFLRASLPIEADGRSVAGSLFVGAPGGTASTGLAVGARTFAPRDPSGSFGLFYPGLTSAESASSDPVWVHGLREDSAQRSNLALVHRGDATGPIVLRVSFFGPLGAPLGTPTDVTLSPGEWRQLGRPLLPLGAAAGYAKVERLSGTARFAAYGVLNDNVSSDGSYVPMTR